jgi:hypothetical protein
MSTYQVMQATKRGTLEVADRKLVDPQPGLSMGEE